MCSSESAVATILMSFPGGGENLAYAICYAYAICNPNFQVLPFMTMKAFQLRPLGFHTCSLT